MKRRDLTRIAVVYLGVRKPRGRGLDGDEVGAELGSAKCTEAVVGAVIDKCGDELWLALVPGLALNGLNPPCFAIGVVVEHNRHFTRVCGVECIDEHLRSNPGVVAPSAC